MNVLTKSALLLVALGGSFAGGYFSRRPDVQTKIREVEKVVEKKVIVKVTDPDGKITETITEEKESDSTTNNQIKEPVAATASTKNDYALGVRWTEFTKYPTEAEFSYRVFGDVWSTAGYNWSNHSFLLGVRYEF